MDTHEIKKKRGKIVLETAAIYKAAVFEYNDRNKQCKLREDFSNSSAIYTF